MFELRLGLALGKTRSEIRALPATEYRDFELFYMLEPWGWPEQEYRLGRVLSEMFFIANHGKKNFTPKQFMRDMSEAYKLGDDFDISLMTREELKAYREEHRDELIAEAKQAFGAK